MRLHESVNRLAYPGNSFDKLEAKQNREKPEEETRVFVNSEGQAKIGAEKGLRRMSRANPIGHPKTLLLIKMGSPKIHPMNLTRLKRHKIRRMSKKSIFKRAENTHAYFVTTTAIHPLFVKNTQPWKHVKKDWPC